MNSILNQLSNTPKVKYNKTAAILSLAATTKASLLFMALFVTFLFSSTTTNGQKKISTLSAPPANVKIDGLLTEWGDSLKYYNGDSKISYSLANDSTMIYLALRIYERSQQARIIGAGLSFSINPKGKKKDLFCVTYPYIEPGTVKPGKIKEMLSGNDDITDPSKIMQQQMNEKLALLTQMKITGFKTIEYDIITIRNTYGIKAAMSFDQFGVLLYEMEIPLRMFDEQLANQQEWAFNLKINGISKPVGTAGTMGGKGMGTRAMGRMAGAGKGMSRANQIQPNVELLKSIDFWQKYVLHNNSFM